MFLGSVEWHCGLARPQSGATANRALFHKVVLLSLILASTSPIRRHMLEAADVTFEAIRPDVNEDEAKARLHDATDIAGELACAKALSVSAQRSGDWVIGSDSVVTCEGRLFDKPKDRENAAEHLRFFSGKPMLLTSAVALAYDGKMDWQHAETATLQVRELSGDFIQSYLDAEWPEVGYTVGVFRLEGRGVQLFERIEGDHFTVLGMSLLPLLGALRQRGLLQS